MNCHCFWTTTHHLFCGGRLGVIEQPSAINWDVCSRIFSTLGALSPKHSRRVKTKKIAFAVGKTVIYRQSTRCFGYRTLVMALSVAPRGTFASTNGGNLPHPHMQWQIGLGGACIPESLLITWAMIGDPGGRHTWMNIFDVEENRLFLSCNSSQQSGWTEA